MPQFLLIDSDTHPQDAPTLFTLLTSTRFHALGMIVTPSSYPMEQAYSHAVFLKTKADNPTPLYLGCSRGIMSLFPKYQELPPYAALVDGPLEAGTEGAHFFVETLLKALAPVTVLVLGPLTNIALALVLEPRIREKIAEVLVVGGSALKNGDVTPAAEARFLADPHAVSVLLSSNLPLVFFPLDLTKTLKPSLAWIERWKACFGTAWETSITSCKKMPAFTSLAALAYLQNPSFLGKQRKVFSSIETKEGRLKGKLTVDWWKKLQEKPNVLYVEGNAGNMHFSEEDLITLFSHALPEEAIG